MQDIRNILDFQQSLPPAARIATATGTGIDTVNYNSIAAVFEMGAITDGTHTPVLQESDDNSTFTPVAAANMTGTLSNMVANSVQKVGYLGVKRYLRASFTIAGATTGAVSSAVIIGGDCRRQPV
ncbi:hypothetical protein HZU75_04225 [Chitinibacter fontanus]|uniref:Uncharacterized protein n=1 Tax=Chitinibacter fontanus TaxID=1737446 RepID=A0A7D5V8B6_9NEIS|nr:hypothetical protein [Chitinibacter fontanus]QLI80797.1 hypothetical protein HZU75_04225 [Chitinibacter fontanus]